MSLTTLKKGDTVILHMFTGVAVGVKEIIAADKSTITLETRAGAAKFSRKTGKQVEPKAKSDRFANYVTEDDGSFVPANKGTGKKKAKKAEDKKATKKTKAKPVEDDEDEAEDEPEVKPAKAKKAKAEKPAKPATKAKKSKKAEVEAEEEDFDEYEEE